MNGNDGSKIAQSKGGKWLLSDGLESNFSTRAFMCKCCGMNEIHQELIDKLEKLRTINKTPIYITGGGRCPAYNKKKGGKIDSFHLPITEGVDCRDRKAAEKQTMTIDDAEKMFYNAIMAQFFGIGIYNAWPGGFYLHVDIVRYTYKRPANKAFWYCINEYLKGGRIKRRHYTTFSDAKECIVKFKEKIQKI